MVRVEGIHDPVRVKGYVGRSKEQWMMREIEARNKEAWVRYRQQGSSVSAGVYNSSRWVDYVFLKN